MATAMKTALNKAGIVSEDDRIVRECVSALTAHPHDLAAAAERAIFTMYGPEVS